MQSLRWTATDLGAVLVTSLFHRFGRQVGLGLVARILDGYLIVEIVRQLKRPLRESQTTNPRGVGNL